MYRYFMFTNIQMKILIGKRKELLSEMTYFMQHSLLPCDIIIFASIDFLKVFIRLPN